jgi:hypothetical protein
MSVDRLFVLMITEQLNKKSFLQLDVGKTVSVTLLSKNNKGSGGTFFGSFYRVSKDGDSLLSRSLILLLHSSTQLLSFA